MGLLLTENISLFLREGLMCALLCLTLLFRNYRCRGIGWNSRRFARFEAWRGGFRDLDGERMGDISGELTWWVIMGMGQGRIPFEHAHASQKPCMNASRSLNP